jgi:hypothetical protein
MIVRNGLYSPESVSEEHPDHLQLQQLMAELEKAFGTRNTYELVMRLRLLRSAMPSQGRAEVL